MSEPSTTDEPAARPYLTGAGRTFATPSESELAINLYGDPQTWSLVAEGDD